MEAQFVMCMVLKWSLKEHRTFLSGFINLLRSNTSKITFSCIYSSAEVTSVLALHDKAAVREKLHNVQVSVGWFFFLSYWNKRNLRQPQRYEIKESVVCFECWISNMETVAHECQVSTVRSVILLFTVKFFTTFVLSSFSFHGIDPVWFESKSLDNIMSFPSNCDHFYEVLFCFSNSWFEFH